MVQSANLIHSTKQHSTKFLHIMNSVSKWIMLNGILKHATKSPSTKNHHTARRRVRR